MPSGKQGQGRQNGGADRGIREQIQDAGQRIQEGAQQASQHLRENFDDAREEAARQYRRAEGMMARNPTPSVLIGFGIGFGLGLVLTTMLAQPEETWAERHLPDRLRRAPESLQDLAEAVARHLPKQFVRG